MRTFLVCCATSWLLTAFIVLPLIPTTQAAEPFILGAWYNPSDLEGQSLEEFEQSLGVFFNAHKRYLDWDQSMDITFAKQVHAQGRIPEITWQPWIAGKGVAFGAIASGTYDAYVTKFAQEVKTLPFTIQITLAAEMNGWWSPWTINGEPGRTAQDFIAGWRRVHTIFQQVGATNVKWVWAPNVVQPSSPGTYPFAELYPGHAYVDYLGLDGYNFGSYFHPDGWETFREVFEYSYNLLGNITTNKPILIMEVASNEHGGDKAAWIRDMFVQLPNFPRIRGFTWFNRNRETDWRIASSPASKQAFKEGAALFFGKNVQPETTPLMGGGSRQDIPTPEAGSGTSTAPSTGPAQTSEIAPTEKVISSEAPAERGASGAEDTQKLDNNSVGTRPDIDPTVPFGWVILASLAGVVFGLGLIAYYRIAEIRAMQTLGPELHMNFKEGEKVPQREINQLF